MEENELTGGYSEVSWTNEATFISNVKKTSSPKDVKGQTKAIKDNLRYALINYQQQLKIEKDGIDYHRSKRNLGIGGEQFQEDFVHEYKYSISKSDDDKKANKKEKGENRLLKKVSKLKNYDNIEIKSKTPSNTTPGKGGAAT